MGIGVERKLDGKPKGGKKKSGLPKKDKKKDKKKVKKTKEEEKKIAEAMRQMRIREAQKTARRWAIEESDGGRWSGKDERKGEPGNRAGRSIEELNKWRRQSRVL